MSLKYKFLIIVTLLLLVALGYSFLPKDADPVDKLPTVDAQTNITAEFHNGGYICIQTTTMIPDKLTTKTIMKCKKREVESKM